MELPTEVLIHNSLLGLKGGSATLLRISGHGYYEVNLRFGEKLHRTLLPVADTVVIARQPEASAQIEDAEIER